MKLEELAAALAAADETGRLSLLSAQDDPKTLGLAYALKSQFDAAKMANPELASSTSSALTWLARQTSEPHIKALSLWTEAIEALQIRGQAAGAAEKLDESAALFSRLGDPLQAAATEISRLQALGMLSRYDEAMQAGARTRDVLLAHGDVVRAGVVDQNLGNVCFRRDRYSEAEKYFRMARERFITGGDPDRITEIDICLATSLIHQHRFKDALAIYREALRRAEEASQKVYQAVIEGDLGCLALFQGRFGDALDYLEKSRRLYADLGMRHQSAIADQELADAYLELNLAPEASAIYARVIPTFDELGMQAEQARALACLGRASVLLGRVKEARADLAAARVIYGADRNSVGLATVDLSEAQLCRLEENHSGAAENASKAEGPLAAAGRWELSLFARWIRAEALGQLGSNESARALFQSALVDAELRDLPQIAQKCNTSIGALAARLGDVQAAEQYLKRSIDLIEDIRLQLPSDELRAAFVADKMTPYAELVRLCLAGDVNARAAEALGYVERARSRALLEMMSGSTEFRTRARDSFEAKLLDRLEELREELNWLYNQMTYRTPEEGPRSAVAVAGVQRASREHETEIEEISRQLHQRGRGEFVRVEPIDVDHLQRNLGEDSTLVEYFEIEGELLAFVVTNESVKVVPNLTSEVRVSESIDRLWFQINSLRFGAERVRGHLDQLLLRTQRHLKDLYEMLFAPVDDLLDGRRAIIVPHRRLHYVPFQALHDGYEYLIEKREISYSPSASVLLHCLATPRRPLNSALLLGVPDSEAPRVEDEVLALAPLFPDSSALLGSDATLSALKQHSPRADIVHLACHGRFRSDNPLFSSLQLGDGWMTVRDAYKLDLNCELVTLSACETGMSAVAPGDEIIGLARGFLSAGAPSLLATLWTVDDEAAARLMSTFYGRVLEGYSLSSALRFAQLRLLEEEPHPYFWSPFMLMGRW